MRQLFKRIEDKTACILSRFVRDPLPIDANKQPFAVLGYHRVSPEIEGLSNKLQPTWNVTPANLRAQLGGLLGAGFKPISVEQAIRSANAGEKLDPNSFCVTFDDGYANTFSEAAPILKELNIPATVFLATEFIGSNSPLPFDDWTLAGSPNVVVESWKPVSLETCRQAIGEGIISLGGHTHQHLDFRNQISDFKSDLRTSIDFLEKQLAIRNPPFAFPFGISRLGFVSDEMIEAVKFQGYSCAFNFDNRIAESADPFRWNRIRVETFDTAASIQAKVQASYSRVRDWIESSTSFLRLRSIDQEPNPIGS